MKKDMACVDVVGGNSLFQTYSHAYIVIDGYVRVVQQNQKRYLVHMYVKYVRGVNKHGIMGYY